MSTVEYNLSELRKEIVPYKPIIIAVTKYFGADKLIEAYNDGLRDFGENRVQDALGFSVDDLKRDFSQIIALKGIKVEGLMNIAPIAAENELKVLFKGMRDLKEELQTTYSYELKELSMGMSNDYKTALEYGATMIRIGRKLFT